MARLELTRRQANAKSEATGASAFGGTVVSSPWLTGAGGGQADFAGMVASLAESASWATSRAPMKVADRLLQEALQENQTEEKVPFPVFLSSTPLFRSSRKARDLFCWKPFNPHLFSNLSDIGSWYEWQSEHPSTSGAVVTNPAEAFRARFPDFGLDIARALPAELAFDATLLFYGWA